MPRKNRLTGSEIRRLRPEKRLISSLFSLSVTREGDGVAKVATVVSKKVSPKAAVRNLIKRRMRAALAERDLPSGCSLVLTAKKPAAESSFADIKSDIFSLVGRVYSGK